MGRTPALGAGVSVVIPVRDRAEMLAGTLRSVGEQTVAPAEIIVADDGSRDDSAAVAREAGATVIVNEGARWGPSRARNMCLERVRTELVWPLDSDDLLLPSAIDALAGALEAESSAPFAFGRALVADRDRAEWRPHGIIAPESREMDAPLCSLYARNFVPSCAVVARTTEVLDVGGWAETYSMNGDHHLWLELARKSPPIHVPEIVSVYRRHRGNLNEPLAARPFAESITRMAEQDARLARCRPERLGAQLIELLTAALRARRPREAWRAVWGTLGREPRRGRILGAAFRSWRSRRGMKREAETVWEGDPRLRGLLAGYR